MPDLPAGLHAVDRLKITVLVDNVHDSLTPTPAAVTSPFDDAQRRGLRSDRGANLSHATHGLSYLLALRRAGAEEKLLFDGGPDGPVLLHNEQRLGADLAAVGHVVISHGHWDHTGGLLAALERVGSTRPVPVHAHPAIFTVRGLEDGEGRVARFDDTPSRRQLEAAGAVMQLSRESRVIAAGSALLSGEIPRRSEFERGTPGHVRLGLDGAWQPEPDLLDESWLAVVVDGLGAVVFSACSHAGNINVLTDVAVHLPGTPIHAVVGGLHLAAAKEALLQATATELASVGPAVIIAGHCTGWRAMAQLAQVLPGRVIQISVGQRIAFGRPE